MCINFSIFYREEKEIYKINSYSSVLSFIIQLHPKRGLISCCIPERFNTSH